MEKQKSIGIEKNETQIGTFPYKFQTEFPILNLEPLSIKDFANKPFKNIDYCFLENELHIGQFAYKLHNHFINAKIRLNGVQHVAYHIMSINSIHIYATQYLENIQKLFAMPLDQKFALFYASYHLMLLEELLDRKYPKFQQEFSQKQTTEIICNCRRKLWNLYLLLSYFPKDFLNHKEDFLEKYGASQETRRSSEGFLDGIKVDVETEIFGFQKNLLKKGGRLYLDYSNFYIRKIEKLPGDLAENIKARQDHFTNDFLRTYLLKAIK